MVAKGPPLQNTPECSTLHWHRGASDEAPHNNWCRYFKTGTKDRKVGGTGQCFGVEGLPIKQTGLKRQSALFRLPYWEVSVVVLWSSIVADNLIMPCIVASILIYDYLL
jgi:hypothetical protein